jgi:predicted O-methyltransferase YrrM
VKTPYPFYGSYAGCYSNRDMAMDERHVGILHGILLGWPFKNALELGSFCGASSTAFVEAINGGSEMIATFCDAQPTESLWSVVRNCEQPGRVRVTADLSWHVLESPETFDFVLVDANHDLESVSLELERLLVRKPLCVMAHDTNATRMGYPKAEGAHHLKRTFQQHDDYYCIEDAARRDGEQTERGLFLATTDPELFRLAVEVYRVWR